MRLVNERRGYSVTPSLICWVHTQNDPWPVLHNTVTQESRASTALLLTTVPNNKLWTKWQGIMSLPVFLLLWPSDTIRRHKSGLTLAQVMVCCLTAPSHYLNQCWLIINKVQWHFTRDTSSVTEISLKITYLKFCSNLPGANELRTNQPQQEVWKVFADNKHLKQFGDFDAIK